jgi:hypothetical protein
VGSPVGVGIFGCGMNGYWPVDPDTMGSDFATTIVAGRFVVAGYHINSWVPLTLGSFWSAYER